MTPQEFEALFPGKPFAIHRVERGPHGQRRWIWYARFTSDYFTTDSDRLVYDHQCRDGAAEGETLELALDALVELVLEQKGKWAKSAAESQRQYEQELSDFRKKIGR